jgi:hypothetical protein
MEFSERVVEGVRVELVEKVPTIVCTHLPVELVEHVRVEGVEKGAVLLCAHLRALHHVRAVEGT